MNATFPSTERPSALRVWISAVRIATLPTAVSPVVVGSAIAWKDGVFSLPIAAAAAGGALFIQIGTNLFNDYADFQKGADTERRVGPARACAKGWLSSTEILVATAGSFLVASILGVYLLVSAGWPVVAIGTASIAAAIAYTGGPYPLAYVGLGDVFVFIFFGLIAVMGTYFVQAETLTYSSLAAAVPVGLLATAVIVVNNLRDRHTDAEAKKRTLAVRFGARFSRRQYSVLIIGAYSSVAITTLIGVNGAGWLLTWASLPVAARQVSRLRSLDRSALNPELGRTAALGLMFSSLLSLGALL